MRGREREPCSLRRGGPIRSSHDVRIDAARAPGRSRNARHGRRDRGARRRQALRPATPLCARRPGQLLSGQRARIFGGEQLPADAERRRHADRHRLRQGRAGDPRPDRTADGARTAAVAVPAAAQRVHVDQQRRNLRRALQRRAVLHQQPGRGAVVRFRRQGERPQHPGFDAGHRGNPDGHDPARASTIARSTSCRRRSG